MAHVTPLAMLCVATIALTAGAQERSPIETDRPDFTEASSLVSARHVQLETGWTSSQARGDNMPSQYSWPEVLLRIGLSSRLEARLGQSFASVDPGTGERFTAHDDLYAGVKVALAEQRGARPQFALLLQATIPTGDDRLTNDEWLPGGALLAGWGTDGALSYAAGLQFNRLPVEGMELGPSVAVGLQLSPSLKGYGEWFAFAPVGAGESSTAHYANGGFALRVSDDAQLDARVGAGLNDAADRVFFGLGFSIRR